MFMNLDALPPGQAMFTLYVAPKGTPFEQTDEYDQVAAQYAPETVYLVSQVVQTAREALVRRYGDDVLVYGVVNQSMGEILYDARSAGFRPIPVVPPGRLTAASDRPYDMIIDLCRDEHDGLGTGEYLDFLLGG